MHHRKLGICRTSQRICQRGYLKTVHSIIDLTHLLRGKTAVVVGLRVVLVNCENPVGIIVCAFVVHTPHKQHRFYVQRRDDCRIQGKGKVGFLLG